MSRETTAPSAFDEICDPTADPNPLAAHYRRFRVDRRLLLTGHSHQAWPDAALAGHQQAWLDAAERVDGKWARAFERADRVRTGYRARMDDPDGLYTLASSTHDLVVRFLSALPLRRGARIVTTDQEFYSLERQLRRLEEEGIEVTRVASRPEDSVGERIAAAVDDATRAVCLSTVFFQTARIAGGVPAAAEACRRHGVPLLLDVYHQLNAVPFSLRAAGLTDAYVVGGGYKYLQLGEGNAFLRFPAGCELRPVVTGWFAEFGELSAEKRTGRVRYAAGDERFAGATYDPTSHYRAAAVFDFFDAHGLDPGRLRKISQHQVGLLRRLFDELDLDPGLVRRADPPLERLGGFLALESPRAGELETALAARGVSTDSRGALLRLGPAPYLSDRQLGDAIAALGEAAAELTA